MMNNYRACDNPEHDRFAHRITDCRECTPETSNSGVGSETSNSGVGLSAIGRSGLLSEIERLSNELRVANARIAIYESSCTLPGWFCMAGHCLAFNSEAKESRSHCRCCDTPKPE